MTKEEAVRKVVDFAKSNIGYHEVGNNLTKFAEESTMDEQAYGFSMDGQPWCDFYVDYCFWKSFGFITGQKMIYQYGKYGGAACMNSAQFYRDNGAWYSRPEVGDQVIYAGENHTGLVVEVYGNGTYDAVDGNYSDSVVLRKGLPVATASGFGRPNWSLVVNDTADEEPVDEASTTEAEPQEAAEEYSVGDIVAVKSGAVWSTGASVPPYYIRNYYVAGVQKNGTELFLQNSTDGVVKNVNSAINIKYVSKLQSTAQTVTQSWGISQQITEKLQANKLEPVVLNPSKPTFSFGGRRKNVEE